MTVRIRDANDCPPRLRPWIDALLRTGAAVTDSPEQDSPEQDSPEQDSPEQDSPKRDSSERDSSERDSSERDSSESDLSRDDLELICGADGFTLRTIDAQPPLTLHLDYVRGPQGYRLARAGQSREDLVRALGRLPRGSRVLDASAGLGRDGLLLAARGFRVVMLERHPMLAVLLGEALERARAHPPLQPLLTRVEFQPMEAIAWLATEPEAVDAAIFDPMFPPRNKDAAVKKEMQVLHRLLGAQADPDAGTTLAALRRAVRRRVVVKRPLHAPPLGADKPTDTIRGRSTRFDIYLPNGS